MGVAMGSLAKLHAFHLFRLNRIIIPPSSVLAQHSVKHKRFFGKFRNSKMSYTTVERGAPNTTDFRIYLKHGENVISPLHDIPLYADEQNKTVNMVVEVPRWTNAKMEINLKEKFNPIKQDMKNGKLRYVANCFPHHGYIWNYGALPQTWENPEVVDQATGCKGDNDPIDVLEIGHRVAKRGEVLKVKILGTVALIDEGETDWKIIVIDINDPLADQMNDIADIEKHYPGLLKATIEWFKIYKIPDGKPENQFAFNGDAKSRDFALNVVEEVHEHWKRLIENPPDNISCMNSMVEDCRFNVGKSVADEILEKSPAPSEPAAVDSIVDKWHYVHLQ